MEGKCPFPINGLRESCKLNDCVMYWPAEDLCALAANVWRLDAILKQLEKMTKILEGIRYSTA